MSEIAGNLQADGLAFVSARELSIKTKPQARVEMVAGRIVTSLLENRQGGEQFYRLVLGDCELGFFI